MCKVIWNITSNTVLNTVDICWKILKFWYQRLFCISLQNLMSHSESLLNSGANFILTLFSNQIILLAGYLLRELNIEFCVSKWYCCPLFYCTSFQISVTHLLQFVKKSVTWNTIFQSFILFHTSIIKWFIFKNNKMIILVGYNYRIISR